MGDSAPFASELFIYGKCFAVVTFVAIEPVVFQLLCLQGSACGDLTVNEFFELCKLYLAVHGSAYCFQELVEKINFLVIVCVL